MKYRSVLKITKIMYLSRFMCIKTSKFEPSLVSGFRGQKNGLAKPFARGKKVVDLTGSYSNLDILNQLEMATGRVSA